MDETELFSLLSANVPRRLKRKNDVIPSLAVIIGFDRIKIIERNDRHNLDLRFRYSSVGPGCCTLMIVAMESPIEMNDERFL